VSLFFGEAMSSVVALEMCSWGAFVPFSYAPSPPFDNV